MNCGVKKSFGDNFIAQLQSKKPAKYVIAISSGKGGVGKSTIASNLSLAFSALGLKVALLDLDIYGPSIVKMFGVEALHPELSQSKDGKNLIKPIEKFGVQLLSIAMFTKSESAIIWRGQLANRFINQMFNDVDWQDSDIMIVDLPPGTGDIAISLYRSVKLDGAVMVTTAQEVALIDVRRAITMFRTMQIPILGIVENMSEFICPDCHKSYPLFSSGKAAVESEAKKQKIEYLAKIPFLAKIASSGDEGVPIFSNCVSELINTKYLDLAASLLKTLKNKPTN